MTGQGEARPARQQRPVLRMGSTDAVANNVQRVAEWFPHCVTEVADSDGVIRRRIDFDRLRQELSDEIVDGPLERYQLDWPGKRAALLAANTPTDDTLRPCRQQSLDFDNSSNLFIEGDNLQVLKLLQETFLGKVKLIYIDPPYNTGGDFIYNDSFVENRTQYVTRSQQRSIEGERLVVNAESNGRFHSDWLSMMLPRLKLARNLLQDDGVIMIAIDEHELHNLWAIGNEVFGRENFVECFAYQKKAAAKGIPPRNMVASVHEYILCYQRSAAFSFVGIERSPDSFANPDNDPRGPWRNTNCKSTTKDQSQAFTVEDPATGRKFSGAWAHSEAEMRRLAREGVLIFPQSAEGQLRKKEFFRDMPNPNMPVKSWLGLYDAQENTQRLDKLLGGKVFQNPKSLRLMTDLIRFTVPPGALVLDFFAGSGTTVHAVQDVNAEDHGKRRWIAVQVAEPCPPGSNALQAGYATIADITRERIRRAAAAGGSDSDAAQAGTGFRAFRLDSSNLGDSDCAPAETTQDLLDRWVETVKPDRSEEDLLFQLLLNCGIDIGAALSRETIAGYPVTFVADDRLAACFAWRVSEPLLWAIARRGPQHAVFRELCFAADEDKQTMRRIFTQCSPETQLQCL